MGIWQPAKVNLPHVVDKFYEETEKSVKRIQFHWQASRKDKITGLLKIADYNRNKQTKKKMLKFTLQFLLSHITF